MSTDYKIICCDCKEEGPIFASGSIAYGFKVWASSDMWGESDVQKWLGHRKPVGSHEGHDLRIVHEEAVPPHLEDGATQTDDGEILMTAIGPATVMIQAEAFQALRPGDRVGFKLGKIK